MKEERIPNLENNNYSHVLSLDKAIAVAVVVYLVTRVQRPSPLLLLTRPGSYMSEINSAGGIVLYQWFIHVGGPVIMYQHALREARGAVLPQLHAYAFHMVRCPTPCPRHASATWPLR